MGLPVITIEGRLTADPELRFTPSGQAVASFTVVSTKRKKNEQTNEWEDDKTLFLRCSCWRTLAENVAESMEKGDLVTVVGELSQREYEKDGQKRTSYEVNAYSVSVSLQFRKIPHGAGKVERTSTTPAPAADPWASAAPADPEQPPF